MPKENDGLPQEEQFLFTPSRNPYAVLPGFIKGWAITDLVFSGLWCAYAVLLLTWLILLPGFRLLPMQFLLAALTGGLGIGANVALLSRKPGCMKVIRLLIAVTLVQLVWQIFLMAVIWVYLTPVPTWQVFASVLGGLILLGRITLLCFYWTAAARAGRYFARRRQQIGF